MSKERVKPLLECIIRISSRNAWLRVQEHDAACHPSSRRVTAALPPVSPAPTMTTTSSPVALAFIVKNPHVLSSQNRHLKRKEGWEPSGPIRSLASLCTCSTFVVYHIVFRHDHWIVHQNCSDVPTAALLRA